MPTGSPGLLRDCISEPVSGRARRQLERRLQVVAEVLRLEERCLLSEVVPIPASNPRVDLSTIFWNGEATPLDTTTGIYNIPSPVASGAAKTITITNYGADPIYPFLRSANDGQDPNDPQDRYYDPQDLHVGEFREYVGYTKDDGSQFLGLPSGASITFQVPLVLWDGDNISLVTDAKYLTTSGNVPGSTLFGYDSSAKISIAGTTPVSNTTWVQGSSHYPKGESPLVMFYYAKTAATVSDDAPSQPAEVTFRDPYLKNFIDDAYQTFPLINYDVTNVNKLSAPASMEASNVAITSGAVQSRNLEYYPPSQDFGWHGSDKGTTSFDASLKDFVDNTGDASLGMYFDGHGWPMFYNPNKDEISIPSVQMCSTSALWMCTGMSFIRPISTRTAGSSRVAAVRDRPAVKERSKRWRADSRWRTRTRRNFPCCSVRANVRPLKMT